MSYVYVKLNFKKQLNFICNSRLKYAQPENYDEIQWAINLPPRCVHVSLITAYSKLLLTSTKHTLYEIMLYA